jgi:PAS domain S-box-containing protein
MSEQIKNSVASNQNNGTKLAITITDQNGIIIAANNEFEKISEYKASELKNKAFNFLIHSDTPKILVKMLWQHLNNKENIVVYLKQKSKSDKTYWTCTSVFQIKNGFIILSIKANTKILSKIKKIYSEILLSEIKLENEEELQKKFETLINQNFQEDNYYDFMSVAFNSEMKARSFLAEQEKISASMLLTEKILKRFLSIINKLKSIYEDTNTLNETLIYCQNFDYSTLSKVGVKNVQDFVTSLKYFTEKTVAQDNEIKTLINESFKILRKLIFFINTLRLQIEVIEYYKSYKNKLADSDTNKLEKISLLEKIRERTIENMQNDVQLLITNLEKIQELTMLHVTELEKIEQIYTQIFNVNTSQNEQTTTLLAVKYIAIKMSLAKETMLNIIDENKDLHEYSAKTFSNCKNFNEEIFKQESKANNAFERF